MHAFPLLLYIFIVCLYLFLETYFALFMNKEQISSKNVNYFDFANLLVQKLALYCSMLLTTLFSCSNNDTIFMMLSSWRGHCESSPGSFDECRLSARWPSTLKPSQPTWPVSQVVDLPWPQQLAVRFRTWVFAHRNEACYQ